LARFPRKDRILSASAAFSDSAEPKEPPMPPVFVARVTHEDRAFSHPVLEAENALDAAIRFAERWAGHGEISGGELSVTVTECATGREQCFRIDLDDESAEPC
jgi:hypothetical protein